MSDGREPPDYEAEVQAAARMNARYVRLRLSNGEAGLLKSIHGFAERFGYAESVIEEKVDSDEIFAAMFALEPSRQRIHEQIAAAWIRDLETVDDFHGPMARTGSDALYVTAGGIIGFTPGERAPRALSFMWTTGETEFFALHTYTKEAGGYQDARARELLSPLEYFRLGSDRPETALVLIADGEYYTPEVLGELRQSTRTEPPLSYVCPIGELPAILASHAYPD